MKQTVILMMICVQINLSGSQDFAPSTLNLEQEILHDIANFNKQPKATWLDYENSVIKKINAFSAQGNTFADTKDTYQALMTSIMLNRLPLLQALIEQGKANPNNNSFGLLTVLEQAIESHGENIFAYLLSVTDINLPNKQGVTPLIWLTKNIQRIAKNKPTPLTQAKLDAYLKKLSLLLAQPNLDQAGLEEFTSPESASFTRLIADAYNNL